MDGEGDDVEKIKTNLLKRMGWIWDWDMEKELEKALETLKA